MMACLNPDWCGTADWESVCDPCREESQRIGNDQEVRMRRTLLVLSVMLGFVAGVAAQSPRAYEHASDHASFKREPAQPPVAVSEPGTAMLVLTGLALLAGAAFAKRAR